MTILCYREYGHLMLGIPTNLKNWSITAEAVPAGTKFTLYVDGILDIPLLSGKPIDLNNTCIEITNFKETYDAISKKCEYINIAELSDGEISYIEAAPSLQEFGDISSETPKCAAHSKWEKVVKYLGECCGITFIENWLQPLKVLRFKDKVLTLAAPNEFHRDLIAAKSYLIHDAYQTLYDIDIKIEVETLVTP